MGLSSAPDSKTDTTHMAPDYDWLPSPIPRPPQIEYDFPCDKRDDIDSRNCTHPECKLCSFDRKHRGLGTILPPAPETEENPSQAPPETPTQPVMAVSSTLPSAAGVTLPRVCTLGDLIRERLQELNEQHKIVARSENLIKIQQVIDQYEEGFRSEEDAFLEILDLSIERLRQLR